MPTRKIRKPKSNKPEFVASWRGNIPLAEGEACGWKRHARYALRQVLGYLDYKAAKNDSRFVWTQVDKITAWCTQYNKGKKPYSKRAVEYALEFLEELGIIARVQMEWRGTIMRGHIVAPHDQCCMALHGRCDFWCGPMKGIGYGRDGKPMPIMSVKWYPTPDSAKEKFAELLKKYGGEKP